MSLMTLAATLVGIVILVAVLALTIWRPPARDEEPDPPPRGELPPT